MRMSASFLRMRSSLRYAEPVRLDGCLGADSVSRFSIFSFNSISVIGFTIWHSSCYRRNTMPATALLRMLLFLRFLALLLEWYHLFHWWEHLHCLERFGLSLRLIFHLLLECLPYPQLESIHSRSPDCSRPLKCPMNIFFSLLKHLQKSWQILPEYQRKLIRAQCLKNPKFL